MKLFDLILGGTKQEQKKKRIALCAIIITVAVLVVTVITLCVTSLIFALRTNTPDTPDDTENTEDEGTSTGVPSGYVEKTFEESQLYSGTLILTNEANPLNSASTNTYELIAGTRPKKEDNGNIYSLFDMSSAKANPDALNALNKMMVDFYDQNKDDNLYIASPYEDDNPTSEYASGTVFVLTYYNESLKDKNVSIYGVDTYNWLYENAQNYGFITTGSATKAQTSADEGASDESANVFRYVGVAHAMAMKKNRISSFAEYLEFLKNNSSVSKPLTISTKEGTMRIYYCSADATAYVPTKNAYTVSGNNKDGYIITVNTSKKVENTAQTLDTETEENS